MLYLSMPANYILELTQACNNRCAGCGNVYAHRSMTPMPSSTWKMIIESFAGQAAQITLSGGEPTLHPEFFDILTCATARDALVNIFTNGRWVEPRRFVERLRGWPNLGGLLISLHGATAASHEAFTKVPGSFNETLSNIALAVEAGIPVALSSIITHQSWQDVDALFALARRIGIEYLTFPRYIGPSLPGVEPTREELSFALQRIEALHAAGANVDYGTCVPQCFVENMSEGCTAGAVYVAIDPWGNVRPCNFSPTIIGSLHEHSMHDLWHSDKMNTWRALMPDECTTCAAYSVCHGGCRAVQELRAGGRDPLRGKPLVEFRPQSEVRSLPADVRPHKNFRKREEAFGYVLLGQGHAIPVAREAVAILAACDGSMSFAELAVQFGQPGLDLLGELWERGLLQAA